MQHKLENKEINFQERQYETVNKEIYELLTQIISNLHIVFILRIEVFLDRAAVYYQNHSLFKKLKMILSKRKSNYNLKNQGAQDNFESHLFQIQRYLDLTGLTLEELFQLNNNFRFLSSSLNEKMKDINERHGEIKIEEFNRLFDFIHIEFDHKGLSKFDEHFLTSLIVQTNGEKLFPFLE